MPGVFLENTYENGSWIKKTDIEYEMLEKVIFSLNRKIDMGDNPYKMKSFGNLDDPDILSDFLLDF